jgi:hypothetical protein
MVEYTPLADKHSSESRPVKAALAVGVAFIVILSLATNKSVLSLVSAPDPAPVAKGIETLGDSPERLLFSSATNLSNNTGISDGPEIASNGQNVYVAWTNFAPNSDEPEIFFKRSIDGGKTFGETIDISNTPDSYSTSIAIAASGKHVYVVWQDGEPEPWEIYIRVSNDYGATFGKPVNLSNNTAFSSTPFMVASGSDVYVAWNDDPLGEHNFEIYLRISRDSGASFGDAINISDNPKESYNPKILVIDNKSDAATNDTQKEFSGKNVYVAWEDYTYGLSDILVRISTDGGGSFGKVINISNDRLVSGEHSIAVSDDGSNIYLVWQSSELSTGMWDPPKPRSILFKASYNAGKTFGYATEVSYGIRDSFHPAVAAGSGDNVYVVWDGYVPGGYNDILLRKSSNGGLGFSQINNLSNNPSYSRMPAVMLGKQPDSDKDTLYVMWADDTPNSFVVSYDSGKTFSDNVVVSDIPTQLEYPVFAMASMNNGTDKIYTAWHFDVGNSSLTNFEVFFSTAQRSVTKGCQVYISLDCKNAFSMTG